MARPKKPILLHKIDGTDHGRKKRMERRKNELQLPGETPDPPEWLDPEALAEWDRLTKDSRYGAVIARVDRAMLVMYCQLWSKFVDSQTKGEEFGGRQLMTLVSIASKLGLSPSDRTKVQLPSTDAKSDDPWAQLG